MSKHDNVIIPLTKLIVTPHGAARPLCNTCIQGDCSHRIEYTKISVLGVTKKIRCLMSGETPHIVVSCQGYAE